jgi:phosphatidylinositol 4-kinase
VLTRTRHPDPFYIKEEFAPSDRAALARRQTTAHNLLAPHSRLLQFLSSHFNATRLGSPNTQRIFIRLLRSTLSGLGSSTGHPLARELRFQVILFGLRVMRYSTTLTQKSQVRLKDQLFTAALTWFAFSPRWSFGSNRLQLKAEMRLLADVVTAIRNVAFTSGSSSAPQLKTVQSKEELLVILLESEQARLTVWLNPLGEATAGGVHLSKEPTEVRSYVLGTFQFTYLP